VQRQIYEAFGLRIKSDKAERRIELSAAANEVVANASKKHESLGRGPRLSNDGGPLRRSE